MKRIFSRGFVFVGIGVAAMLAAGPPSAAAAYLLVDDFESYTLGNANSGGSDAFNNVDTNGPWYISNQGGTGTAEIQDDGDQFLAWSWSGGGNRNPNRTVPTIADGTVGTYYFQIANNSVSDTSDFSVGLSSIAAGGTEFSDFNTFEAQVAMTYDAGVNGLRVGVRDGGSFVNDLVTNLSFSTWYDVWVVVDNSADTYDVYFGQTGDPNTLGVLIADDFSFRNAGGGNVGDLVTFLGIENQGGEDRSLGIDNIQYSSIAVPEPASVLLLGLAVGGAIVARRKAQ